MDAHQRRVWTRMTGEIDRYHTDQISLGTLVSNLQGHFDAVNVHDPQLMDDFRSLLARIDGEHELRTEPWAPPGAASDDRLRTYIDAMREWLERTLATSGAELS